MVKHADLLLDSLAPPVAKGNLYPYKKLVSEQREYLMRMLLSAGFWETGRRLLGEGLAPYQVDLSTAMIELQGQTLSVGSHYGIPPHYDYEFFRADLPELFRTRDLLQDPLRP